MIATNPDFIICPYMVGDIYITTREGNPAQIWPGTTWEQITDRFIRGADGAHPAGSTGGSWEHSHGIDRAAAYIRLDDENTIETIDGGSYRPDGSTQSWEGSRYVRVSGHTYGGITMQDRAVAVLGITQDTETSPNYFCAYIWLRTA